MELLNKGSIGKILRGEQLDFPIVLLVEEISILCVTDDGNSESKMLNVRLRLSDSIDSFFGFLCKTNLVNQLKPGTLVCIEAINVELLDGNKILCKITKMNIIHDKSNNIDTEDSCTSSVLDTNELNNCVTKEELTFIRLADVDLGTGNKNIIRGRVISKSSVRTYDLDQHKLFYFDIMDKSGTLRAKAFDRQCDRLIQSVGIGEMIELSKFYVIVANKKYNQLNTDYEIVVQEYTKFLVLRDVAPIPVRPMFQFHLLKDIELLQIDGLYDVIGIIKSVSPITVVQQRTTCKPLSIVRLLLYDSTGNIEVSLWNDKASNFIGRKNDILAVKGFRLRLYHNKYSLNSVMDSDLFLNPACEEAEKLRSLITSSAVANAEIQN